MLADLRHLDFTFRVSATSHGAAPKAFADGFFYKVNNYNAEIGFYNYSAMNDVIATRYLRQIGIPCLHYEGTEAIIVYEGLERHSFVNWSMDYRDGKDDVSLESVFASMGVRGEQRLTTMKEMDSEYLQHMFAADYLVGNRDRHGGNIRLSGGNFVPLFDFNVSLFMPDAESRRHGIVANNYIGTPDLEANLKLVEALPAVCAPDYNKVFEGLDYPYREELEEWLTERRVRYAKIRDSLS